ncbi:MAG: FH2 domain-containing protein [archaeon]|nr:FH2 domain-containing protein [archaeon]
MFWTCLKPNQIKGTIWDGLDDTKIKLNLDTLDEMFCVIKKEAPKVEEKKPDKKEKLTFLEPDRAR